MTNRESFGAVMEELRHRAGKSRHKLAIESACDPSYLVRIAHGDRDPPRMLLVESIARALNCSRADRNRLLVAAEYAPTEVLRHGWNDCFQAVADVLTDPHLSPEDRDEFRTFVQLAASHWRGGLRVRSANGVEAH